MGAKSGMTQMLIDMLGIDPQEIQNQALQFKATADSIANSLIKLQQQNAAIMRALNIPEVTNGEIGTAENQAGNGTPGVHGQADRPDAGTAS